VSVLPTDVSAGTYGETPPCPCGPWHCEQANWTNVCAPAATAGLTVAPVDGADVVPPATVTVVVWERQLPRPNPTAVPAATTATAAIATAGQTQVWLCFSARPVSYSSMALLRPPTDSAQIVGAVSIAHP